jgi:hypothetical protein
MITNTFQKLKVIDLMKNGFKQWQIDKQGIVIDDRIFIGKDIKQIQVLAGCYRGMPKRGDF